jgi:hypothetical protein
MLCDTHDSSSHMHYSLSIGLIIHYNLLIDLVVYYNHNSGCGFFVVNLRCHFNDCIYLLHTCLYFMCYTFILFAYFVLLYFFSSCIEVFFARTYVCPDMHIIFALYCSAYMLYFA